MIVDVARAARERGDALHLPRAHLAELLDRLAGAGAARILVDMTLVGATTPKDDAALEAELAGLSPARGALVASAVVATDASGAVHWWRSEIAAPFARPASRVP